MRVRPWFALSLLFVGCCSNDGRLEQHARELAVLNEKIVHLQDDLETLRKQPPPAPPPPVVVAPAPTAPPQAPVAPHMSKRNATRDRDLDMLSPRF